MTKKKILTESFIDTIAGLDDIILEILGCFDQIGNDGEQSVSEETVYLRDNTKLFYNLVGNYTAYINRLLEVYFENPRDEQLKYKPEILYYRQVHEYLGFLLRYPAILKVKSHDELKQTRYFMENKMALLVKIYNKKAAQESALFEGNFRNKLENILGGRVNRKIERIKNKDSSNLIE